MGFLLLVAIGWAMCHMFEGKSAEYRAAQDQYRKKLDRELRKQHPIWDKSRRARALWWGARRNALGHFAYQLRHGWSPAVADMRDGFAAARKQHQEWVDRRVADGQPMPSLREAIRSGWRRAKEKFRKNKASDAVTGPTPRATEPPTKKTSRVRGAVLRAVPDGNTSGSGTGGNTVTETMTGEAGTNIGTYRQHLNMTEAAAAERIEQAQAEIAAADQEIASHETTNASLLNAGLGNETAGGMTDLMEAAMQRKAAAVQRLQAAEQAAANARSAREKLRTEGHENVAEAVQGASGTVGNTEFYKG